MQCDYVCGHVSYKHCVSQCASTTDTTIHCAVKTLLARAVTKIVYYLLDLKASAVVLKLKKESGRH